MHKSFEITSVLIASLSLFACGSGSEAENTEASSTAPAPAVAMSAAALPTIIVHKSESCGCCSLWVDHMKRAGFTADVRNADNLDAIKTSVGIPVGMGSCHTAQVGRYFVEGHVPPEDVKRLLAENPDAKGLTVPRMPMGAPGMEVPSGEVEPYEVLLVANDGTTSVYARHGGGK